MNHTYSLELRTGADRSPRGTSSYRGHIHVRTLTTTPSPAEGGREEKLWGAVATMLKPSLEPQRLRMGPGYDIVLFLISFNFRRVMCVRIARLLLVSSRLAAQNWVAIAARPAIDLELTMSGDRRMGPAIDANR